MFRSKQDVDRHVQEILKKIDNQQEKFRRGYNFARMYYQVKEFNAAKQHLMEFLSVKDYYAPAHKLLAQICETTGDIEKALQSYKQSLEIDPKQKEIVLKICELYCNLPVDCETAKYWVDRADRLYPHNDIVFRLKERILSSNGEPNWKELENLISSELSYQPNNLYLRLKHIQQYLDTGRVKEAFAYIIKIESKGPFPSSTEWYHEMVEVFEAYQAEFNQELDMNFYIHFLSALDKLVTLTLSEEHATSQLNSDRSTEVLKKFDQYLQKALNKDFAVEGAWRFLLDYMKGQLYMHLGSLFIQKSKKNRNNWNETVRVSAALYLMAYSFKPSNVLQALWFLDMQEQQKMFTRFYHQGAMRTSFVGHSIIRLCGENDRTKWLTKIKLEVCLKEVRDSTYNKLFGHAANSEPFFLNDQAFIDATLEFPMQSGLTEYDKSFYIFCPDSLHNLIWLHLQQNDKNIQRHQNLLQTAFKGLQYSNNNLSRGSCESLCVLDLEAYLIAVLYTTNLNLDKRSILKNEPNPLTVPPDIADSLCTTEQASWWQSAYGLVNQRFKEKFSEHRQILQRGLEVIRGIGVHGLEVQLVVHLARTFSDMASVSPQESPRNENKPGKFHLDRASALESRAVHYWNLAIGMLDTLASSRMMREPKDRMFASYSKSLSREEITTLQEEGQLYLACKLINSNKFEEAIERLEKITSPFASYYMSLAYKKLATEESKSNVRSALLHKAKDSLFTTMDRIKGDPTHSLNEEIHLDMEEIEGEIENHLNCSNANNVNSDVLDYDGRTPPQHSNQCMTPLNNFHSTPRATSLLASSRSNHHRSSRVHVQPSPERLDAQIRALTVAQTTSVKTIVEQQKSILDMHTAVVEELQHIREVVVDMKESFVAAMENLNLRNDATLELKKQFDEFLSNQKTQPKTVPKKPAAAAAATKAHRGEEDHELANYEGHEYLDFYVEDGTDGYRPTAQHDYGYSRVNRAPASNVGYPPPHMAHYGYNQYHHNLPPLPESQHHYYSHGLPFTEGQTLPQFQFHVPVSVNKPPGIPPSIPPPPTNPWTKTPTLPHAFQIPMPAPTMAYGNSPSVLSTPTPYAAPPLATITSPPKGAGDFSFSNKTSEPGQLNRSRQDSDVYSDTDIEREVMGDFKPVIPLPDEVIVETGEEDELVLFEDRAKLFRFVDKEWKERGIGKVKILKDEQSGRIRLLMRRDQVYKVCANHAIKPYMEIQPLKDNDKALTWAAQDFADGTVKLEKFCIRFKTADVAASFKEVFEEGVKFVTSHDVSTDFTPPSQSPGLMAKALPKPHSWNCASCLVNNPPNKAACMACESARPNSAGTKISEVSTKSPFTSSIIAEKLNSPVIGSLETKPSNTVFGNLASSLTTVKPVSGNFDFSTTAGILDVSSKPSLDSTLKSSLSEIKFSPKLELASIDKPKPTVGGFTFNSTPIVAEKIDTSESSILVVSTKAKDGPQVTKVEPSKYPFSDFCFKPTTDFGPVKSVVEQPKNHDGDTSKLVFPGFVVKGTSIPDSNKSSTVIEQPIFGSTLPTSPFTSLANKTPVTSSPIVVTVNKDGRQVSGESVDDTKPEEFVPTAEFQPVVPLPALVEAKTGEEDAKKLFGERVRLYRFDTDAKEWKERGTGELKILEEKDGKFRIVMRREQVHKICANHYILPEMKLSPLSSNEKAWAWFAQDFSDMTLGQMHFSARFKNKDLAQEFRRVFDECLSKSRVLQKKEDDIQNPCVGSSSEFVSLVKSSDQLWDCQSCQTKNENTTNICKTCGIQKETGSLKPLSEIYKTDPGSWECPSCYVRNSNRDVCIACESLKPGAVAKPAAVFGQFNFKSSADNGFVFGSKEPSAQPKFPSSDPSTVFGSSNKSTSVFGNLALSSQNTSSPVAAPTAFVFGKSATTTSPSELFSKPADQKVTESTEPVEFKFGSPQKYEFNFSGIRARSPSKGPKSPKSPGILEEDDEDEEVEPSDADSIYFQPVIPLPPEVDVKTGEEGETILFCKRSKLFRFVQGEWKERGIGDIKILLNPQQNNVRLLMRRDQVLKVCLNHYLSPSIEFSWKGKNSLSWSATDFSENTPSPELFAIRFKLQESAVEFKEAIDSALELIGKQSTTPIKSPVDVKKALDFTPKNPEIPVTTKSPSSYAETLSAFSFAPDKGSTSPFSLAARFGSPSSSETKNTSTFFSKSPVVESKLSSEEDVAVVFEATATPEQIAAAEKLMLPPNFYLYESKPPCPGCRGCDEEDRQKKVQLPVPSTTTTIPSSETDVQPNKSEKPADIIFNTSAPLFSFADIATKDPNFVSSVLSTTSPKAAFPGAGAPVFGQPNKSQNADEDSEEVAQAPDIHFDPVIPLPDLVEVKTGEEDETVFFCNRSKLYVFDMNVSQWKERGVGDLKILQHNEKCRFRVIQRREQVHKISCNHLITPTMDIYPMRTSDSALCWSAIDFTDGDSKTCQFAIRFKNTEILEQFRQKFEEAKAILRNEGKSTEPEHSQIAAPVLTVPAPVATIAAVVNQPPVPQPLAASSADHPYVYNEKYEDNDDYEEEDDDDDEEEEDEDLLFSDYVEFGVFDDLRQEYKETGAGTLQVVYDDSVYGYRILMRSHGKIICDHIIAIQTHLATNSIYAMWAAVDISVNPPQKRQFRATFESRLAVMKFVKVFEEGKEIAVEAEILEKSGEIVLESPTRQ